MSSLAPSLRRQEHFSRLMCSLITFIFPCTCESWTLTAERQKKKKKERKNHGIEVLPQDTAHLIKDHVTNEEVFAKIQQTIGLHEDLTIANRSKLKGCGHVSCSLGLAKTILQGTVIGGRRQGRQKKRWEDNTREGTGLVFAKLRRTVENRKDKKKKKNGGHWL